MNHNSKVNPQEEAGDLEAGDLPRNVKGCGNLLFHVHSTHFKPILFAKESTSLQFYEHLVIATTERQFWCFPKRVQVDIIPRFKIVDAAFSLGPRSISRWVYLLLIMSITLISVGAAFGGCDEDSYDSNAGTCASLAIGIFLLVPMLLLAFLPFCFKWHFIYLGVRAPFSPKWFHFGGTYTRAFRFKKIGFDDCTDNKAAFDEFYLVEYVFGSLGSAGKAVADEAHLISHFHHAALATPIVPVHADNTIRDLLVNINERSCASDLRGSAKDPHLVASQGLNHRKKHAASHAVGAVACEL